MAADVDPGDEYESDVERMAEARVHIEEKLEQRQNELEKIGDFSTAYCTEFRQEDGRYGVSKYVVFRFEFPDGTWDDRRFDLETETESLRSFMDEHGADSVTDMIGAEHACVYTNDGWEACHSQSVDSRMVYSYVFEDGRLFQFHWPSAAAYILCILVLMVISISGETVINSVAMMMLVLSVGVGGVYLMEKTEGAQFE